MVDRIISGFLANFSLVMLVVAVVLALTLSRPQRSVGGTGLAEQMFRWVSLLAAGVVGIYTAVTHVFFPERTAELIGWQTSPFQYEVGMADLAIGVLGIMAFRASFGFRAAATVATAIWLWGDAVGHVRQMLVADNFAPGNAGPWFWSDVLVPLVMTVSLAAMWRQTRKCDAAQPLECAAQIRHTAL